MAKRKNLNIDDRNNVSGDLETVEPIIEGIADESDYIPVIEVEELISETKVCKIVGLIPNAVHVDFDGYGVAVHIRNPELYKNRKMIRVSYSGEIGQPDFKAWLD